MIKHTAFALVIASAFMLASCQFGKPDGQQADIPGKISFSSALPVPSNKDEKLAVISSLPSGRVSSEESCRAVSVTFSKSMVPLSPSSEEFDGSSYLSIEPAVKGKFRWKGTSTLVFIPDSPLAAGTRYKASVKAGIKSVYGDALEKGHEWTMEIMPPAVKELFPDSEHASCFPSEGRAVISFNQKIDPEKAKGFVKLFKTDGKSSSEVSAEVRKTVKDDLSVSDLKRADIDKCITVTPSSPLAKGSEYRLDVCKGFPAGDLEMNETRSFVLRSENNFDFLPFSGTPCPDDGIYLPFSNPVNPPDLVKFVTVTPETALESSFKDQNYITSNPVIYGSSIKPRTEYKITVRAGAMDINGNKLKNDVTRTVMTGDCRPDINMQTGVCVFDKPYFPIKVINMPSVSLACRRLSPYDAVRYCSLSGTSAKVAEMESAGCVHKTLSPPKTENQRTVVNADISDLLEGGKGIVYIAARFPEKSDSESMPMCSLVQITDMSIHLKASPENSLVWVTGKDGKPVEGADIAIRKQDGSLALEGRTDSNGCFEIKRTASVCEGASDSTFYVFASKGNDTAFVSSDWDWGVNIWDLGLNTSDYRWANNYAASIFTEKGIYRPGEKVGVKGIIRTRASSGLEVPEERAYRVTVSDSRSNEIFKKEVALSSNGSFEISVPIPDAVPFGECSINVRENSPSGKYVGFTSFGLYDYKPADLAAETKITSKAVSGASFVKGSVKAEWLFGAPLKDAEYEWTLSAEKTHFVPEGCDSYYFGIQDFSEGDDGMISLSSGKGKLGADGKSEIKAEFSSDKLPNDAEIMLESTVKSAKSDLSSSDRAFWHSSELFIGAKPESFIASAGKPSRIDTACFDESGKAYKPTRLSVSILRRTWTSVRKDTIEDGTTWISKKNDEKVMDISVKPSEKGFEFTPEQSGYYVARITGKDRHGRESVTETGIWACGSGECGWEQSDSSAMKLSADKKSYKPGETAKIFVPSPYKSARALVTTERNNVSFRSIERIDGSSSVIEIPISASDVPVIYASVLIVPDNPEPGVKENLMRIGYAEIPVDAGAFKLSVSASPDKKDYRPGEKAVIRLSVKDSEGRPARGEIAVAVIDEGTLALKNYRLPDIFSEFYGRQDLCVSSYDMSSNALSLASYSEKGKNGGGGTDSMASEGARKNFSDAAYWNPSVAADSSGEAEVSFTMPDSLTSFRVMAVAFEGKKFSGLFDDKVTVSQPLAVKAALPVFMHAGDEALCGVTVVNNSPKKINAKVTLSQKSLELLDSSDEKTVSINPGSEAPALFRLKALKNGVAQLSFKTEAGTEKDEILLSIPVIPSPNGIRTAAFAGISSAPSVSEKVQMESGFVPGSALLKVYAGACEYDQLAGAMDYLDSYRLNCLEQLTSKIFPYVDAADFMKYEGRGGHDAKVDEWIKTAGDRQYYNGGFMLWENGIVSDYLTCYVMEALIKAEKAGYKVPENMKNNGVTYLSSLASRPIDKGWNNFDTEKNKRFLKAYAAYDLYLAGRNDDSVRNTLAESVDLMDLTGKAMLLRAFAASGGNSWDKDRVRESIMNSLRIESREAWFENDASCARFYGSDAVSTAMAYTALTEAYGSFPESDKVFLWLTGRKHNGAWRNTHENALGISAVSRGIALHPSPKGEFKASARLDGEVIASGVVDPAGKSSVSAEKHIDSLEVSELSFEKNSGGNMYYNAVLSWQPKGEIKAYDSGFSVMKIIESADSSRIDGFAEGGIYKVTISVSTPSDRDFVVVSDSVPAGFRVINTAFRTESAYLAAVLESIEASNRQKNGWSSFNHIEYGSDSVSMFADRMSKGEHLFTYFIKAVYKGRYSMYPAKAELMYSPEVAGASNSAEIEIK